MFTHYIILLSINSDTSFEIRAFNLRTCIVRANEKRSKKIKIPLYVVQIISNLLEEDGQKCQIRPLS